MTNLHPFLSGISGVVAATGILVLFLTGRQRKMASIETELTTLRDGTVQHLCDKVEKHIDSDQSQVFATKLETLIAQNNEQLLELKKLNREGAAQGETMKRNEKSLNNIWEKFDQHRQDREIHHA
jgi:hypothetical protein